MSSKPEAQTGDLTLVLDIGKSHAKLLMFDADGAVVEQHGRANRSVTSALGYPALDVGGLAQWVTATLAVSPATRRCRHAIASTHGAAFVALGDDGLGGGPGGDGLAWDPIDYEFDGLGALHDAYQADRDDFAATQAPDLPAGLNAARPLHWLQHTHPDAWARTRCLLPYPQYWAWWLSGVAASEVSSLGCHTQLWRPAEQRFSDLAVRQGWAERFAPLRPAWQVLGRVRADRARETGLSEACEVHVGVHDSNAGLARWLRVGESMTLVSTGTWIVVMTPGASVARLDPARDMLANVSVLGQPVPTGRFMGGRELEAICAGAPPALASLEAVAELLRRDVHALPSFAAAGGPFPGAAGVLLAAGVEVDRAVRLEPALRASLAALYCAQVTAYLLERLGAPLPLVVEGPFADNPVYLHVLAALLPPGSVRAGGDAASGTARGAWRLAHWDAPPTTASALEPVNDGGLRGKLEPHHRRWLALLDRSAVRASQNVGPTPSPAAAP